MPSIIVEHTPHTLLAKVDIKSVYRLLPVYQADKNLLAMELHNNIYIDSCLIFRLHSTSKLFNILANLLSWIAQQQGISKTLHYPDDFVLVVYPHSPQCHHLSTFMQLCTNLGIPLASKKIERPSTSLTFYTGYSPHGVQTPARQTTEI